MSATEPSIFETIFKQSLAPMLIVKANAPEFTIIAQNRELQQAMHNGEVGMSGKSAYELFFADPVDLELQTSYTQLTEAFNEAISKKKIVKLPAVKSLVKEADGQHIRSVWRQMEVVPVMDDHGDVTYLNCPSYDIAKEVWVEAARKDGLNKEHDLTEELAASNEELNATNDELRASNEELRQSQDSLSEINQELEKRVIQRMQALSDSESRFRAMVEQSPVPMLVTMGEAMIFDIINQPMLDLIGKDASVIGMPWHEAMPELEGQDIIRQLLDTYDSGKSWEGSEVPIMIYKTGTPVLGFYNISYKPLIENGKTIGMLQSAIDVTNLVRSRLLVEEMNREEQAINEELTAANETLAVTNGELQTTKQLLEQIINMLPASVVVIRGNELIVESINQANLDYWNKTKEQVIGKPFLEILPDLAGQAFPGQLRQVIATGEVIDIKDSPVLFTNADGTQRETFVDYTYQPLTDHNGQRNGVLVMSSENTGRVNARKLLEQYAEETQSLNEELTASNEELAAVNEELLTAQQMIEEGQDALRLAIDAAEFGTWFIHSVTREFVTDARLKEFFGYYPDEPLSIEQAIAQITEEYRGFVATTLENAIYHNGDYDVTYPVVGLHDQRLRWLRAIGNLKADPSGAFSAFTGVVMDITEQVTVAEKVKTAEENLRLATESAELATWYLNEQLGTITASARFNELFGFYPGEEVPYTAAVTQIVPEYRQMVQDAVTASFNSGANFNVEYPIIGYHDGKQRWIRSVGKFVADEKNGNYITGVMADITEQKTDELRKNDFIGMVSHELKTPLTSLTAIVQVLHSKLKRTDDAFVPGALAKAEVQVKKMSSMINGFLNISRLESGKIVIDKQPFIIDDLLKEMAEESSLTGTAHRIVMADCDKVVVKADREKIGSVISNILSNAVKYSPKGTEITIKCKKLENEVQISVTDEGLGIRPEDRKKLFDRFYRVEGQQTKHISGFGIGLYLSAEIIERHAGKIWVESEIGKGSTFYFSLPLN